MGSNLPPNDYKSNTKPLSCRTNDENSRSNSLLTFKCELLFQVTEQSYSSLFTLTIVLFQCQLEDFFVILITVSSEKLAQVISAVQGLFLKLPYFRCLAPRGVYRFSKFLVGRLSKLMRI